MGVALLSNIFAAVTGGLVIWYWFRFYQKKANGIEDDQYTKIQYEINYTAQLSNEISPYNSHDIFARIIILLSSEIIVQKKIPLVVSPGVLLSQMLLKGIRRYLSMHMLAVVEKYLTFLDAWITFIQTR